MKKAAPEIETGAAGAASVSHKLTSFQSNWRRAYCNAFRRSRRRPTGGRCQVWWFRKKTSVAMGPQLGLPLGKLRPRP